MTPLPNTIEERRAEHDSVARRGTAWWATNDGIRTVDLLDGFWGRVEMEERKEAA